MRRAFALLLVPFALMAQEPRCTVEGMVVNAATGEALRRAVVTLRRSEFTRGMTGPTSYTAATDSMGKYAIAGVEPGTYVLTAERNGFAAAHYANPVKLDRGQKSSGLLMLMTPHAVITGRVMDEDGEPVVGADVQVSTLGYVQGRKMLSRGGGAMTNDLGEYRVFGLPAGRYFVSATFRANPVVAPTEEYATTYYPRTTDAASAVPLQVPAGAQLRNIDVTLARTRTVSVRGRVNCDIEGQKRTFTVMLTPRLVMGIANIGMGSRSGAVQPDGTFELPRVAPGGYMLMASATVDEKRYTARTPLQVGATNVDDVQVSIRRGGTVSGKLVVEGRPEEQLAGLNVGLQSWESGGILYGPTPSGKTQADGSFQLEDVNADRYTFYVNGLPEGYYVKSVRSGGVDVMTAGLEVGGGAAPLDVLVSPNAGALEGTAMDPRSQKPAVGATVALLPRAKERNELYRTGKTDEAGSFRFKNIVPGEYRVYVWETVEPYAWMDPDFMRPLESKGEAVSIPEGSPQSVQAAMIVER